MKNFKRISAVSIIGLVLLCFSSCEDTTDIFHITTPSAPVLADLNFTQIELDPINTSNPALTLNWTESDYGQQTANNYAIQFASDDAFTLPTTAATITGQNALTLSVSEINAAAGNAGLNPFTWATLYTRVVASLGPQNGESITSNTIQFDVYPYFNYIFNDYYLVGDAAAPGWNNNNNNPPLFRDENNSDLYYYTGLWADNGHFKVLETKGLWQPQWGTDDGSTVGNNPGGGTDPERFPYGGGDGIPEGFYTFTINFASDTFTFEPFDATGITSPATLSIQGSSVTTTAMTALTFDGHIWYANGLHLVPGDVTFLADSGTWGGATSFSGVAANGGDSIPVIVEDDYDVWFNDLTGRYILIPLNL